MDISYRHDWNVSPEEAIAIQKHLADLTTSIEMVMRCTTQYRLPVPIRAAYNAAGQYDSTTEDKTNAYPYHE